MILDLDQSYLWKIHIVHENGQFMMSCFDSRQGMMVCIVANVYSYDFYIVRRLIYRWNRFVYDIYVLDGVKNIFAWEWWGEILLI